MEQQRDTTFDPAEAGWLTAAHTAVLLGVDKKTVVRRAKGDDVLEGVQRSTDGMWFISPGSVAEWFSRRQAELAELPEGVRALRPQSYDENAALRQQVASLHQQLVDVTAERDDALAAVAERDEDVARLRDAVRSLRRMADLGLDGLLGD